MSVYHPHTVTCVCGDSFTHALVESANVERSPAIRQAVLDGTLHRVHCPRCGQRVVAEVKFYFADPKRNSLFLVKPGSERFRSHEDSEELAKGVKAFPASLMDSRSTKLRVVYGLDELREKLICEDAGIDDRTVEVAKLYILRDHPFLTKHNRLVIHLTAVKGRLMHFVAGHKNRTELFQAQLPLALLDELAPGTAALPPAASSSRKVRSSKAAAPVLKKATSKELAMPAAAAAPGLFKGMDHFLRGMAGGGKAVRKPAKKTALQFWVNFRELSNRNEAKAALRALADAVKKGATVPLSGPEFNRMIRLLQGNASALDSASKQNLQVIFDYAVRKHHDRAQELLTEVRFGVPLDDEWSSNTARGDIPVLWRVMSQLPASNVAGNVSLKRIDLSGSDAGGEYDPNNGFITIFRGTASARSRVNVESFEDTLRHEVGHAVHWRKKRIIDEWLKAQFGWETFEGSIAGVLAWAERMGAAAWPAGTSDAVKRGVAAVLATSLPPDGWEANPIHDASASPAVRAVLASKACGLAKAWRQTGSDWYNQCDEWFVANGRRFFVNFWYGTFMSVKAGTIALVRRMPDLYAAMSPEEFFAELYALWYDKDDPDREVVPQAARKWFAKNVG